MEADESITIGMVIIELIKYGVPIIALIISTFAYLHSKKIYWETIKKPFTLMILPDGEITFWDSSRHFGKVSINLTFFNSGNEPDLITDLYLVSLDAWLSMMTSHMYASEYLSSEVQLIFGKEIGVNKAFSGIQLGPKAEKKVRIMFDGDREEVFYPEINDVYIAYKTVMKNEWRLSNIIISCETSYDFFDSLAVQSKSIPLLLKNNKNEGKKIDNPFDQLWN